ncbi:MAG: ribose 5-phosphate isomerase B [Terriglobia bacterium]
MKVAFGADHAGFQLKQQMIAVARAMGHEIVDLGTHSEEPVDYPDFSEALALTLCEGRAVRGVLVCGSGVGASVAANKIPGIRAGLCHDTYSAHQGVEHDDMNILVLGGRVIGEELAHELMRAFLGAHFSGEERHCRRLEKVKEIEARYSRPNSFI